jgi:hypothetical protein
VPSPHHAAGYFSVNRYAYWIGCGELDAGARAGYIYAEAFLSGGEVSMLDEFHGAHAAEIAAKTTARCAGFKRILLLPLLLDPMVAGD